MRNELVDPTPDLEFLQGRLQGVSGPIFGPPSVQASLRDVIAQLNARNPFLEKFTRSPCSPEASGHIPVFVFLPCLSSSAILAQLAIGMASLVKLFC